MNQETCILMLMAFVFGYLTSSVINVVYEVIAKYKEKNKEDEVI